MSTSNAASALTKRCGLAGCFLPFAVGHLLKWRAGNKGPLATREPSGPKCSGQDNRAERWPGLLATCQLVSTRHRSNRAQRSRGGGGGEDVGRTSVREMERGWHLHVLEFFSQWWTCLLYIVAENVKWKLRWKRIQMCRWARTDTHRWRQRRVQCS